MPPVQTKIKELLQATVDVARLKRLLIEQQLSGASFCLLQTLSDPP